ncbi:MAG: CbtA family protein [Chthoniobacterales bacterium]|uniref:CbtA family protein n=1 Tax=Sphingobium TaxID=165695 RepID=UPI001A214AA6|nr:CbtA family protein [Sphingobium sp.]MBJ7328090.1 CbtA family protein [Chthoniobacterales bacterium]MBJ7375343.1 CbtA family protein [Sphingobium sp.]
MTKSLLWRGMLAGILAALIATMFARAIAEPQIDLAIDYESAHVVHHMDMPSDGEQAELVSRATQKGAGLLTALALYGAAVGGIFALIFAYGYGRFGRFGPRSFALLLSGIAIFLVVIVPGIKYPQTPPAVGKHETVGLRTAAYFAMIALSVGGAVIAAKIRSVLALSRPGIDATLIAVGAYGAMVVLGQYLLPSVDEVPADFPATLLWNFRLASIATQLLLWATIGIVFGLAAERVMARP